MPLDTSQPDARAGIPSLAGASIGGQRTAGAQAGIQWQVQTQLDPVALSGGSPSTALERATRRANRIERTLPGRVQSSTTSLNRQHGRSDALYAEDALHMLAVPAP